MNILEMRRQQMKDKKLCNWWNGDFKNHNYFSFKNVLNTFIFMFWFAPSISLVTYLYLQYVPETRSVFSWGSSSSLNEYYQYDNRASYMIFLKAVFVDKNVKVKDLYDFLINCPLGACNILMFLNSLSFYIIGIL